MQDARTPAICNAVLKIPVLTPTSWWVSFAAGLLRCTKTAMKTLNIHSRGRWPASSLSNFASHTFVFRGIQFKCIEALVQGIKFKDVDEQKAVFALSAREAKKAGRRSDWRTTQTLWWQGEAMGRLSQEYETLLDEAYATLYAKSDEFRDALQATGDAVLVHRIGKTDPKETVLTRDEFVGRLMKIRASLQVQEV